MREIDNKDKFVSEVVSMDSIAVCVMNGQWNWILYDLSPGSNYKQWVGVGSNRPANWAIALKKPTFANYFPKNNFDYTGVVGAHVSVGVYLWVSLAELEVIFFSWRLNQTGRRCII